MMKATKDKVRRGGIAVGERIRRGVRVLASMVLGLVAVGGCGGGDYVSEALDYPKERIPFPDEVVKFFEENAETYIFAKPEDLPADLVWEDGMDLPEIGSPEAKKGGHLQLLSAQISRGRCVSWGRRRTAASAPTFWTTTRWR